MQLVCQRNSLNRRGVTAREIAELSEILTVQENKGGVLVANRLCRSNGLEGRNGRGRVLFERARSSSNSLNKPKLAGKVFSAHAPFPGALTERCENIVGVFLSLLWHSENGSLLAPSFGEHSRSVRELMDVKCLEDRRMLWRM